MYTSPITLICQLVQTFQQPHRVRYELQRKLAYCLSTSRWFERVDDFEACLDDCQQQLTEVEFQRLLSTLERWLSEANNPLRLSRRYVTDEYAWGSIKYTYTHPQLRQLQTCMKQYTVVTTQSSVDVTLLCQSVVNFLKVAPQIVSRSYLMLGLILTQWGQVTRAQWQDSSMWQDFMEGSMEGVGRGVGNVAGEVAGEYVRRKLFSDDNHNVHATSSKSDCEKFYKDFDFRIAFIEQEYEKFVETLYSDFNSRITNHEHECTRLVEDYHGSFNSRMDNLKDEYTRLVEDYHGSLSSRMADLEDECVRPVEYSYRNFSAHMADFEDKHTRFAEDSYRNFSAHMTDFEDKHIKLVEDSYRNFSSRIANLEYEYARLVEDPYNRILINKTFNNLVENFYVWQRTISFRSDNLIDQNQDAECVGDGCSEGHSSLVSRERQQDNFLSATGDLLYSCISLLYLLAKNVAILAFALFKLMPKLGNLSIAMIRKMLQWLSENRELIQSIMNVWSAIRDNALDLMKFLIHSFRFTQWLSQLMADFLNRISDLYSQLLNKFGMFIDSYSLTKWLRKILSDLSVEMKKQIEDLFENFGNWLYERIMAAPHHFQPYSMRIDFEKSEQIFFQQIDQAVQEESVEEVVLEKVDKLISELYTRVKGRVDKQISYLDKQIAILRKSQSGNDERIYELEQWKQSEEWEKERLRYIVEADQALHTWHVRHGRTLNLDSFNSLMTFYLVTNRKLSVLFQSDLIKEGAVFEEAKSSKIGFIAEILSEVVGILPGGKAVTDLVKKFVMACMRMGSNKQAYRLYLFILEDPINAVVISRNIAWRLTQRYAAQLGQLYPKDITKMSGIAVMLIFMILNDENTHVSDNADDFCETICTQLSSNLRFSSVLLELERQLKKHMRLAPIDQNIPTKIRSSKRILSVLALFYKPATLTLVQLAGVTEPRLQFFLPSDSSETASYRKPKKYGFCFFKKIPPALFGEVDEKHGFDTPSLEVDAVTDLSQENYYAMFLTLFCQPVEIHPRVDSASDPAMNVEIDESSFQDLQRESKDGGEDIGHQSDPTQLWPTKRMANVESKIEQLMNEKQQHQQQVNFLMQHFAMVGRQHKQEVQQLREEIIQLRDSRSLFSNCIIQ